MPKRAEVLGPLQVKNLSVKATPNRRADKPGLYFVGEVPGLAIQLLPTNAKTWVLRYKFGSKRREMGLGGYPEIPLADARVLARQARQKIREGIDPIDKRREERSARLAAATTVVTFKEYAETYIKAHKPGWSNPKHAAQWESTLKKFAYPKIGHLSVADIEKPHVLQVLQPIWETKTETASRLRGRIEAILGAANSDGLIKTPGWLNPARWPDNLKHSLAPKSSVMSVKHHSALEFDEATPFMEQLRVVDGMGARALEFAILTAARSGEVRGATWEEINLKSRVWTIPEKRMKAGKEHRVPLSQAAVDLLEALPRMAGTDFVFPAARGGQLSDMTLSAVLRRMEVPVTVHGFRSTFRDWAGETTSYPREVIEHALAHQLKDKAEAAYARGTLFQKRVELMEAWAQFIVPPKRSAKVVPHRRRA